MKSFLPRLRALIDKSALMLILPAVAALFYIDPAMVKTLLQWSLFGVALAGVSVIISRIVFPQVDLNRLLYSALHDRNTAAGMIVASVIIFVSAVMLALVLWAKA